MSVVEPPPSEPSATRSQEAGRIETAGVAALLVVPATVATGASEAALGSTFALLWQASAGVGRRLGVVGDRPAEAEAPPRVCAARD